TFEADPKIAEHPALRHRHDAARAAALAGCGRGEDAAQLDATEKTRLRAQALAWLQADLAARARQLTAGKPVDRAAVHAALRQWQTDASFAAVRDRDALASLPEAERQAWHKLWDEVVLVQAQAQTK
ncbi:MAG TPA: hypothetical protein VFA26_26235, partial [Gemmataceae bacterium]|nr:hypothetical protein [Gemmataceae bacterium]